MKGESYFGMSNDGLMRFRGRIYVPDDKGLFSLFLYIIFPCFDVYSFEFVLLLYILRSFIFYFMFLLKEIIGRVETGEKSINAPCRDMAKLGSEFGIFGHVAYWQNAMPRQGVTSKKKKR